jgi:diguanylate cyclase
MPSASFDASVEESHAILKQVLPLLRRHRIPAIPQNYALWYDFVRRADGHLVAELEERMAGDLAFSPEACAALHEKYFLADQRAERARMGDIERAARQVMETALSGIDGMDHALGSFAAVLDDARALLEHDPDPQDLNPLVARLAQATRATRRHGAEVEASLHAMAAELRRLRARVDALSRASRLDALTGVAGRRAFEEGLARMIGEVTGSGGDLCLLLGDVDHFERFNDIHGQPLGDQVLRFLAQEMNQCVKGRDLLARTGGEEFAILLPSTSYHGALVLAESIRAIIEAQVVEIDDGHFVQDLTISFGVAVYGPDESAAAFVERARAGLHEAKAQGRNRVIGERDLCGH